MGLSSQYNVPNGAYIDTRYYNTLLSCKLKEIKPPGRALLHTAVLYI